MDSRKMSRMVHTDTKAEENVGSLAQRATAPAGHTLRVNILWSTPAFWWALVLAFLTVLALLLRPVEPEDYSSLRGMLATLRDHSSTSRIVGWGLVYCALTALVYWGLVSWRRSKAEQRVWAAVSAALISWTWTIPGSNSDGWTWYSPDPHAWGTPLLAVVYVYQFLMYGLALFLLLSAVFAFLASHTSADLPVGAARKANEKGRILRRLTFRPIPVLALGGVIFLCWIPIFIVAGPAHLFVDTVGQLAQFWTSPADPRIGDLRPLCMWIADQHPFADTLLFGLVDSIGKGIHNEVLAFAILAWLQGIALAMALAGLFCWINDRTSLGRIPLCFILFILTVSPVFPVNESMIMKDSVWMPFFVAWLVCFAEYAERIFTNRKIDASLVTLLTVFSVLAGLSKKTSPYITCVATVFLLVCRPARHWWKTLIAALVAPVLVVGILPATLYKPLNIAKGNPAEVLAVPMQQVTKAFIDHGSHISAEDRATVNRVMDLKAAEKGFVPYSCNSGVKLSFRLGHTNKRQVLRFMALWARLGARYPRSYVTAVPYMWDAFVPGRVMARGFGPIWSGWPEVAGSEIMAGISDNQSSFRQEHIGGRLMQIFTAVPPFDILSDVSFYVFLIPLLGLMACLVRHRFWQLLLLVPALLNMLVQFTIQTPEIRLSLGAVCVFPLVIAAAWVPYLSGAVPSTPSTADTGGRPSYRTGSAGSRG